MPFSPSTMFKKKKKYNAPARHADRDWKIVIFISLLVVIAHTAFALYLFYTPIEDAVERPALLTSDAATQSKIQTDTVLKYYEEHASNMAATDTETSDIPDPAL